MLTTCGYPIKLGNLKALLKELNFNWNGSCCSLTQLIDKLRRYTNDPQTDNLDQLINIEKQQIQAKTKNLNLPKDQETLHKILKPQGSPLDVLRNVFYLADRGLGQIFREYSSVNKQNKDVQNLE